eukprot:CAMPEP_0194424894 /NCGR_PEP_ID=MMETSP0176-20130528/24200_1 /TAXON_ID=216777 /ORGANISM="Proboscia alata, Strain PI-D3" /LENGTH=152 /DNA_ID=CAMNT_0039234929 /DNA_START=158 /DNA_END=616 /DNA_ORIENTATION=-
MTGKTTPSLGAFRNRMDCSFLCQCSSKPSPTAGLPSDNRTMRRVKSTNCAQLSPRSDFGRPVIPRIGLGFYGGMSVMLGRGVPPTPSPSWDAAWSPTAVLSPSAGEPTATLCSDPPSVNSSRVRRWLCWNGTYCNKFGSGVEISWGTDRASS